LLTPHRGGTQSSGRDGGESSYARMLRATGNPGSAPDTVERYFSERALAGAGRR
jgi:hypothetical protein